MELRIMTYTYLKERKMHKAGKISRQCLIRASKISLVYRNIKVTTKKLKKESLETI